MYGPGVEKVFEELKKIFPNKRIKIFSSDYLKKKQNSENLIDEIIEQKVDILVGTQMISKGYNFPKLNCIIVVDADFTGKGYDLRTTEKNIQLYNQLSGRAGRFSRDSIIVYQTINPEHQVKRLEYIEKTLTKIQSIRSLLDKCNYTPDYRYGKDMFLDSIENQVKQRAYLSKKQRVYLNKFNQQFTKKLKKSEKKT